MALDLYARSLPLPGCEPIPLLGEGTIHQPHGGVSTDAPTPQLIERFMSWRDHYIALTGHDLRLSTPAFTYFGPLSVAWRMQLALWSLRETLREVPELSDLPPNIAAALAADATPQGSGWTEMYALRDHILAARRAAAASAEDLRRIEASWSWRLTAPLRWVGAALGRARKS